jgi:hypothetical protein
MTNLDEALGILRVSSMRMAPPTEIGENLLAAFRERTKRLYSPAVRVFPWNLVWRSAAVLGLVAVVVMLYSALNLRSPAVRTNRTEARGLNAGRHPVQEQLPISSSGSGAIPERLNAEHNRSSAKRPMDQSAGNTVAKLDHSARVREKRHASSIPVWDDWSLNSGGSVVRVTLPLSSLAAMGVPVHSDVSDPLVMADVMMDPFGTVMAIRLVEAKTSVN